MATSSSLGECGAETKRSQLRRLRSSSDAIIDNSDRVVLDVQRANINPENNETVAGACDIPKQRTSCCYHRLQRLHSRLFVTPHRRASPY